MTRRRVHLRLELPTAAIARLNRDGVSVDRAQAWLDVHRIDGCTVAPDLYLVVCAVHDYLSRTGIVFRWQADDLGRDLILILTVAAIREAWANEDELPWRVLAVARCLLGLAYAWLWWAGVVLGDWVGIGVPERAA